MIVGCGTGDVDDRVVRRGQYDFRVMSRGKGRGYSSVKSVPICVGAGYSVIIIRMRKAKRGRM
jgi:hypothetical protein